MKILNDFEQGSLEWHKARCGKITMSHSKELLTGGKGRMRQSYILDVVAERLSGEPLDSYYNADMERGNFLEEWALKAFNQLTGLEVSRVGFVLQDDERIGCSPDGLIGDDAGIEIKCPKPRQHIRTIFEDGVEDYRKQSLGNMWVCEREHWYIVSFCPWVKSYPLYIKRINRDELIISKLAASAIDAANTVDELAEKARSHESTKWISELSEQARDAWENVLADNSEVII